MPKNWGSRTWTFQPDDVARNLVLKKVRRMVGRKNMNNERAVRGLVTKILNRSVRNLLLSEVGGKTEMAAVLSEKGNGKEL